MGNFKMLQKDYYKSNYKCQIIIHDPRIVSAKDDFNQLDIHKQGILLLHNCISILKLFHFQKI